MARKYGDKSGRDAYNLARTEQFPKLVDAAASTATAETPFFKAPVALTIASIEVLPGAAVTADNTNNAVITIRRRAADGTGSVTVVAMTTNVSSGNWVAFTTKSLGTLANTSLAAGQQLTLEITKGGSGVSVPISTLVITYAID